MIRRSLVEDHRDALWDAKGASVMTSPSAASRFPTKGSNVTGPSEKVTLRMGPCSSGLLYTVAFSLEIALSMQILEFLTLRFFGEHCCFFLHISGTSSPISDNVVLVLMH